MHPFIPVAYKMFLNELKVNSERMNNVHNMYSMIPYSNIMFSYSIYCERSQFEFPNFIFSFFFSLPEFL